MTESWTSKPDGSPKKVYTAPVLVPLKTTEALNRLRDASANGNQKAKSLLAQAEAVLLSADK